jgi:hypothetical protein
MKDKVECVKGKGECCYFALCPFSFGIALGVTKGLFVMLFLWAGYVWGYGLSVIESMSHVYYGVSASFAGGFIGFLWGFLFGFVFGVIVGFIYDCCICCMKKRSKSE